MKDYGLVAASVVVRTGLLFVGLGKGEGIVAALSTTYYGVLSRRDWTQHLFGGYISLISSSSPSQSPSENDIESLRDSLVQAPQEEELPLFLRRYTKLAPLGKATQSSSNNGKIKARGLSLQEMADRLTQDLTVGATGNGGYIISGDLSSDLFRDDCVFLDPTNRVDSLSQYKKALTILFEPDLSDIELLDGGRLIINESERTIQGRFRSRGFLKLPWHPFITAYESAITYKIGQDDGLIYEQVQTWSKPWYKALRETFTPTIYTPPPKSNLVQAPPNEPRSVGILFHKVNGRRPNEYSAEERREIQQLMDETVENERRSPWDLKRALGTWQLVYLEPGPEGGGVDRRVPFFPELDFNDQYQVFGKDYSLYKVPVQDDSGITNIGQIFGPSLFVRVWGTVKEEETVDDPTTTATRDRGSSRSSSRSRRLLQATITNGQLCLARQPPPQKDQMSDPNSCLDLPIQGVGLFDSLYLGERLRILQNINGTGSRGIQIRMA